MTNETLQASTTTHTSIPFGMRLQSAREAMRLERKDAAAQLRLSEKIIAMMEKDAYPDDLPGTFIRGYMRSYGKLLDIPDTEITEAIEPIKPKPMAEAITPINKNETPVTSSNYFMQFFTTLVVITMLSLVGMWWHSHSKMPSATETVTQTTNIIPIANPDVVQTTTQPPTLLAPVKPENIAASTTPPAAATAKQTVSAKNTKTKVSARDDEDDDADTTETDGNTAD